MSSGTSQLELVVVDWMRIWIGYPKGAGGLLTSGGSDGERRGAGGGEGEAAGHPDRPAVYMSDQSHSALKRAALIAGVRRENIRLVHTGDGLPYGHGRIAPAGGRGTVPTVCGPWRFCAQCGQRQHGARSTRWGRWAEFCAREGIWLHVDAAYGGFALVTEDGRELLDGIEKADSVGMDAHKWFLSTLRGGCPHGEGIRDTSKVHSRSATMSCRIPCGEANHPNFADRGQQLSRAARALKIWMSVQTFGMARFRAAVQNGLDLARRAKEYVESSPMLELMAPVSMGVVCFRVNPAGSGYDEQALQEVNRKVLVACVLGRAGVLLVDTR